MAKTTIRQYKGNDNFIYQEIGRFSMDRKVLREFKGYPIITSPKHEWFLATEDGKVVAFIAIEMKNGSVFMENDYTLPSHRKQGLHMKLVKKCIAFAKKKGVKTIEVDATKLGLNQYKKAGFNVVKEWAEWTKLELAL